jgi:hypothetical protein
MENNGAEERARTHARIRTRCAQQGGWDAPRRWPRRRSAARRRTRAGISRCPCWAEHMVVRIAHVTDVMLPRSAATARTRQQTYNAGGAPARTTTAGSEPTRHAVLCAPCCDARAAQRSAAQCGRADLSSHAGENRCRKYAKISDGMSGRPPRESSSALSFASRASFCMRCSSIAACTTYGARRGDGA